MAKGQVSVRGLVKPGTLMVEPTESEDQTEIDRFCDAMIAIPGEIQRIGKSEWDKADNPPHPADVIAGDDWKRPYTHAQGAFSLKTLRDAECCPCRPHRQLLRPPAHPTPGRFSFAKARYRGLVQ